MALAVELLQHAQHFPAGVGVEGAGGLVGQDQGRVAHQRPGDGHTLLLAARQLVGLAAQLVAQAHLLQHRLGAGPALAAGHPGVDQGHLHVAHQVELGQQVVLLEHEAQHLVAYGGKLIAAHPAHVPAVEPVDAGGGHVQAADDVHAGGFARAGLAHDGHELPRLDPHGDMIQRLDDGVAHMIILAHLVEFDQCAHPIPPRAGAIMPRTIRSLVPYSS